MANEYTILQSDGVTSFIVHPLESNGPGNSTTRQINAVDQTGGAGVNFFKLRGDVAYRFVLGFTFNVINSAGNDGAYTVTSNSVYSSGPNTTTIIVDEAILSAAVPVGDIQYTNAVYDTSLTIPGRGVTNYGEQLAINSVRMLENFAHNVAPANPITGQIWYNTDTDILNVFDTAWNAYNSGDPHYTSDSPDGTTLAVPPVAIGADSLAMGDGAVAVAKFPGPTLAIGDRAQSLEFGAVAIGSQAVAADWLTVAIGETAHAGRLPPTGPVIIGGSQAGGAGANYFEVAFDYTSIFVPGLTFDIATSTGNDGTYTVVSSSYGTTTLIIVVQVIPSATFDGIVEYERDGLFSAVAIGASAYSYPEAGVAIGSSAIAGELTGGQPYINVAAGATAIGGTSWAKAKNSSAFGYSASTGSGIANGTETGSGIGGEGAIAIGYNSSAYETRNIAIGYQVQTGNFTNNGSNDCIAIGTDSTADGGINDIALGNAATSTGTDSISIGTGALSSYISTVAIGKGAQSRDLGAIAIGGDSAANNTQALEYYCIAIGTRAVAGKNAGGGSAEQGAIAIGHIALAHEFGGVAIGSSANTGQSGGTLNHFGIAVGYNASAISLQSTAIGNQTIADADYALSVGPYAQAQALRSIAIGNGTGTALAARTLASGQYSIALGYLAKAGDVLGSGRDYQISIGTQTEAFGEHSIAIGRQAIAGLAGASPDQNAIAIGRSARTLESNSIAIGLYASSYGTASVSVGESQWSGGTPDTGAFDDHCVTLGPWARAGIRNETTNQRAVAIGYQSIAENLNTVAIGYQAEIRETAGTADVTSVDFTPHTIVGADFFNIHSPTTAYYVWYTVDAAGADPTPGGTAIPVAILSTDTPSQVATKTATAIGLEAAFSVTPPGAAIIFIGNAVDGVATGATDGTNATNATIATSTPGVNKITTDNSVSIGSSADVRGPNAVAIAFSSNAVGDSAISIGSGSNAYEIDGIAIGRGANAGQAASGIVNRWATAIGQGSLAYEERCIAIGTSARAGNIGGTTTDSSIAIGSSDQGATISDGFRSVAIGSRNGARADRTLALGEGTFAREQNGIAIGSGSEAGRVDGNNGFISSQHAAMAIGSNARAYEVQTLAIGSSALCGKDDTSYVSPHGIAIGRDARAQSKGCTAIGYQTRTGNPASNIYHYGLAIGYNAQALATSSVAVGNQAWAPVDQTIAVGSYVTTANVGEIVHSVGTVSNDIADRTIVIRQNTVTWAALTAMSDSPTVTTDTVWKFTINVVARQNVTNEVAAYKFDGLIQNIAGTTTMIGIPTKQVEEQDATWDCDITASGATGKLEVKFQGDGTADAISVLANIHIAEI